MPSLSLDYNSQGGNGILGIGWSLGGLPSIGRCPRTLVQDGVAGAVNYDANDRFCMEGQRLIVINNGTYGADGAEYRTEIESFSRIISHGVAGTGPAWFEVHTRSGQIMQFGNTTDSRVLAQGKTTARNWALNQLADTKSNYLTVTYTADTANGQVYPAHIDYTGNATANLAPYNSVQFVYAARPDIVPAYQAGSLLQLTSRLTDIKTYAGAALVSDYKFTYQQGATSNVSEVSAISVCGPSGACLPATGLQWANGGGTTFSGTAIGIPNGWNFGSNPMMVGSPPGPGGMAYTPIFSDFNRDGKSDFLLLNGPTLYSFLSNGDGSYATIASNAPNGWNFGASPEANFTFITGDFDGNGQTEFAAIGGGYVYVFMGNGDGTFTGTTYACPNGWNFGNPPSTAYVPVAGDFNSDGRTDFLMLSGSYLYVFLSKGDGTFNAFMTTINNGWNFSGTPASTFTPISGDFNGDGKADFLMMGGQNLYEFLGNGDGTFTYTTIAISTGWNFGNPPAQGFMPIVGDFNGDGNSDWLMLQGGYLYEFQSKGDGTFNYLTIALTNGWNFGNPASASFMSVPGDFNGDGKADFAMIGGNGPYIYQFLGNGDGTFRFNTLAMPNSWNFGAPPTANYWPLYGDFNGDGKTDFALMDGTHVYTVLNNAGVGDMISGITGGLGTSTAITYASLSNASVYTKDTTGAYPLVNLQAPLYVASRVDTSNGVGGTYSSTYTYAGAKADLSGRGFLGFRQVTVNDLQTGISDTTIYRQDFPYLGLAASTTRTRGTQTLGQSTNTYQFTNNSGAATVGITSAPYQVNLSQNVASGNDLDGSALTTVTTANVYDAYGNATKVTVSTPDGYSKTATNSYVNDVTNWYLGRLTRASVTNVAP